MRHLALALVAVIAIAAPASAQQVRNLAAVNGWTAYVAADRWRASSAAWAPTRIALGRFFWIKVERLRGELHGFVQVGDRHWNVRQGATGRIVIAIDGRRAELNYTGTSRPDMIEASYQGAFSNFINFVEAFAAGLRMQVTFPGETVATLVGRPARHARGDGGLPGLRPAHLTPAATQPTRVARDVRPTAGPAAKPPWHGS